MTMARLPLQRVVKVSQYFRSAAPAPVSPCAGVKTVHTLCTPEVKPYTQIHNDMKIKLN
jgi:hypothetical protein